MKKNNISERKDDKGNIYLYSEIFDKQLSKTLTIGKIRESKYIFEYFFVSNNKKSAFNKKLKNKRIKNITFCDFNIDYELEDCSHTEEIPANFQELISYSLPFYHFIINNEKYFDIIQDFLLMYSKLQEFFKTVLLFTNTSKLSSTEDLKSIPSGIKKQTLEKFLEETTYFDKTVIQNFLKLFESKPPVNFFKKPLLPVNDKYLFNILNTTSNISLNNIDDWLEFNGINLKERGAIFEDFIKTETNKILKEKKYDFIIHPQKKFKEDNKSKEEEIDLLIIMKDIVLIGELKCIKYPIEHHDTENAKKRLFEGVEQIIHKKEFLENNKSIFKIQKHTIENKKIIPFVLTNYPHFSEYETFGTEFSNEDTASRIKRLNSVNRAKKSSQRYDSNKFQQRMSTAMEIGAMILMILAMVL